jgi:hypothetical protein
LSGIDGVRRIEFFSDGTKNNLHRDVDMKMRITDSSIPGFTSIFTATTTDIGQINLQALWIGRETFQANLNFVNTSNDGLQENM